MPTAYNQHRTVLTAVSSGVVDLGPMWLHMQQHTAQILDRVAQAATNMAVIVRSRAREAGLAQFVPSVDPVAGDRAGLIDAGGL